MLRTGARQLKTNTQRQRNTCFRGVATRQSATALSRAFRPSSLSFISCEGAREDSPSVEEDSSPPSLSFSFSFSFSFAFAFVFSLSLSLVGSHSHMRVVALHDPIRVAAAGRCTGRVQPTRTPTAVAPATAN